jgi:hypothetical protein
MSTHTPGPWHWDDSSGNTELLGARHFQVLEIYESPEGGTVPTAADAALIAAAPDLLDILRKVLSATADVAPGHIDRFAHVIYREVQQRGAELLHRIDRST